MHARRRQNVNAGLRRPIPHRGTAANIMRRTLRRLLRFKIGSSPTEVQRGPNRQRLTPPLLPRKGGVAARAAKIQGAARNGARPLPEQGKIDVRALISRGLQKITKNIMQVIDLKSFAIYLQKYLISRRLGIKTRFFDPFLTLKYLDFS
jgi:hypothetical protein